MAKDESAVERLHNLLLANEETSESFKGLVEKVAPGAVAAATAGEQIKRVVAAQLSEIDAAAKKLEEREKKLAVREEINDERRKLLSSPFAREHGIEAADLAAIEKLMLEEGYANHLGAAKAWVNARIVGAPRGDVDGGITMPHAGLGDYWAGTGKGRSITDGPSPRQTGDLWARDRAQKDIAAIRAGRPLEPAPFPIPEIDQRGFVR